MKNFSFTVIFFLIFLTANVVFAQKKSDKTLKLHETFKGMIVKKPWSKTTQSYCAQGSDYFVFKIDKSDEEIVLENQSGTDLKALLGKKISVKGYKHRKEIKADPNVISQRPIDENGSEDYVCTVLVLTKVLE